MNELDYDPAVFLTAADEQALRDAGYEYHCFISWPRTKNSAITHCAKTLKEEITGFLSQTIVEPKVFLDESSIDPGQDWARRIITALCRSVTMVAVCAPIYYRPEKPWCGREYAAMWELSKVRLPGSDRAAVIPVITRLSDPLPEKVEHIQYVDISTNIMRSRNPFNDDEGYRKLMAICTNVEKIAVAVARAGVRADCDGFRLPDVSAFDQYQPNRTHAIPGWS